MTNRLVQVLLVAVLVTATACDAVTGPPDRFYNDAPQPPQGYVFAFGDLLPNHHVGGRLDLEVNLDTLSHPIVAVELLVGVQTVGVDDEAPYRFSIQTDSFPEGPQTLTVAIYDDTYNPGLLSLTGTVPRTVVETEVYFDQTPAQPVGLLEPVWDGSALTVTWTGTTNANFRSYHLQRSVNDGDVQVVRTFTDPTQTTFRDDTLSPVYGHFATYTVVVDNGVDTASSEPRQGYVGRLVNADGPYRGGAYTLHNPARNEMYLLGRPAPAGLEFVRAVNLDTKEQAWQVYLPTYLASYTVSDLSGALSADGTKLFLLAEREGWVLDLTADAPTPVRLSAPADAMAWTGAADGTLFTLHEDGSVGRFDPASASMLARSAPVSSWTGTNFGIGGLKAGPNGLIAWIDDNGTCRLARFAVDASTPVVTAERNGPTDGFCSMQVTGTAETVYWPTNTGVDVWDGATLASTRPLRLPSGTAYDRIQAVAGTDAQVHVALHLLPGHADGEGRVLTLRRADGAPVADVPFTAPPVALTAVDDAGLFAFAGTLRADGNPLAWYLSL